MNTKLHPGSFIAVASLALATLLAAVSLPVTADEAPVTAAGAKRPKICVVLSGGGARGAAHVGVLKVLEEYRIPVDCIAGTSMGSLVGAAYASGTTIPDMEALMGKLTTKTLFRDKPPRDELHIRRKMEDRMNLFGPELGVGSMGGDMLPKGIVSGVQLETVLRKISAPGYRDFDKLPIPYRAVATDLVTGKEVVFDKGQLANVMRASMSVPVAIAPVEIDGKLLADGMLVNNLPVSVARAMGADVVIAVNVGTPLLKREQLGNILGVAGQMLSILTEQNVQAALASLKPTDILITPELGDFSTGDFDNLPKTLPIGEAAARKVADQLSRLSLSPEEYANYRKGLKKLTEQDFSAVDKVRFDNLDHANSEYLQSLMETQPGKQIDQEVLDKDLRRIYGTSDFEHINYNIIEDHGERILAVDAVEKSWGPNYFRFGVGLESNFNGDANFTLEGLFRKTWMNSMGGEWATHVSLGQIDSIQSQFYQPLDSEHHYFVQPSIELRRNSVDLYDDSNQIATFNSQRYRVGLDLGRDIQEYGQFRVGVRTGVLKPRLDIGPQYLDPVEGTVQEGAFVAALQLDKLDSVTFPTKGWFAAANIYNSNKAIGADDNYTKWDVRGSYLYSFGRNTLSFYGAANGTLHGDIPYYDMNQWGGFLRLSGLAFGQLAGESLTYGRVMYYNKLVDYNVFDGLYAGFSLEAGKMRNPLIASNNSSMINAASVFVATDSPVGPVYLSYGHASTGDSSFYLFMGLPY
jgi:NTE family protein